METKVKREVCRKVYETPVDLTSMHTTVSNAAS